MDTMLAILGIFGLGAICVSAYIFTVAARNYVSWEDQSPTETSPGGGERLYTSRRQRDRRKGEPVEFPLTVNGVLIPRDRRRQPERRSSVF